MLKLATPLLLKIACYCWKLLATAENCLLLLKNGEHGTRCSKQNERSESYSSQRSPPDNSNLHIFVFSAGNPYWPTVLYTIAKPLEQSYATLRTRIHATLCFAFYSKSTSILYILFYYIAYNIIFNILFLSDFCAKLFPFVYDGFTWLNCQTTTFHNKPILPHIQWDCKITIVIK